MLQRSVLFITIIFLTIAAAVPAAVQAAPKKRGAYAQLRAELPRLARSAGGTGGYFVMDGANGRTLASKGADVAYPLGSRPSC